MKAEKNVKLYWARHGAKEIFGSDWEDRLEMSDEALAARFDDVWTKRIEPALAQGQLLSPSEALKLIPNDKRRDFFRPEQEHWKIRLCGHELLVQVDPISQRATQLWHFHAKKSKAGEQQTMPQAGESSQEDDVIEFIDLTARAKEEAFRADEVDDGWDDGDEEASDENAELAALRGFLRRDDDGNATEETGASDLPCERSGLIPEELARALRQIEAEAGEEIVYF